MKKSILALLSLSALLFSCNQSDIISKNKLKVDSLALAKVKSDSINISNIKIKKYIEIDDKSISILKSVVLIKKVKIENDGDTYRYHTAERFQSLLSMRIVLTSKSKAKDPTNFFPILNIFQINKNNSTKRLGELSINLYKKSNLSFSYLEQIYDYVEKETFVAWAPIDIPLKGKIVISVSKGGDTTFKVDNVIGMIK